MKIKFQYLECFVCWCMIIIVCSNTIIIPALPFKTCMSQFRDRVILKRGKTVRFQNTLWTFWNLEKINRKVQEVPQSQTTDNPTTPRGREKWQRLTRTKQTNTQTTNKQTNKQTNAREAHRPAPSSTSEVITMLKRTTKHEDKEHGKTPKHEAPLSISHKATQNKNNTGTTALERPVV